VVWSAWFGPRDVGATWRRVKRDAVAARIEIQMLPAANGVAGHRTMQTMPGSDHDCPGRAATPNLPAGQAAVPHQCRKRAKLWTRDLTRLGAGNHWSGFGGTPKPAAAAVRSNIVMACYCFQRAVQRRRARLISF
jgi:hypothetical protein